MLTAPPQLHMARVRQPNKTHSRRLSFAPDKALRPVVKLVLTVVGLLVRYGVRFSHQSSVVAGCAYIRCRKKLNSLLTVLVR